MNKRFILVILLTLCVPAGSIAAAPADFSADFVQTRSLPGFDVPLVSHGRVHFDREGTLQWTVTRPYHYTFEMAGEQIHETLPDGSQRSLAAEKTPWLATVQHVFRAALTGDRTTLSDYFRIHEAGNKLVLDPLADSLKGHITRITVVDPDLPQRITIDEAGGGSIDIRFEHVRKTGGAS
ncbi:MAG: outer membrane lipoprotein carrier protein LolA [Gammaproteobacteria bacterium]|jgi:hypothetical protein